MEEIRAAAFASYEAGSDELKLSAKTMFNRMDLDGDGKISSSEFADFLRRNNYGYKQELFQEIDRDHNGFLDFWEVVVFFYITETRMIRCDGCKSFIKGTYFICSDCFHKAEGYNLCCACYRSQKYQSGHGPFLDNYDTLAAARRSIVHQQPQPQQQSQATDRETEKHNGGGEELKQLLEMFNLGFTAGNTLGNALGNALVAGCSIM